MLALADGRATAYNPRDKEATVAIGLMRFVSQMRLALLQCGRVGLTLQGQVATQHKARDSRFQQSTAVSVVDHVCQEILLLAAAQVAPELAIYSEEMAACPVELQELFSGRGAYELVVDPVDGTDDYLAGRPTYGHMLGLLNLATGRFDLGMLYFPAEGTLIWGLRGMGAFVERGLGGQPRRLQRREAPRSAAETKRMRDSDRSALAQLGLDIAPSSGASVAWVVWRLLQGEVGVAVLRQFHGHDSGPGSVLLEELGGAMLDGDAQAVRYEADMARAPLVVASVDEALAREVAAALGAGAEDTP
jgi:fructose-1,6-bisphosphatase/inositol monophosphatase family enzyme